MMNREDWNQIIRQFSPTSLLQTWEWGEIKSRYGWAVDYKTWQDDQQRVKAAALILKREQRIPILGTKLKILYVPKGPLLDWQAPIRERVLADLKAYARQEKAVYIKIDPELFTANGYNGSADYKKDEQAEASIQGMLADGWVISNQQIQFKNTFVIDLQKTEDEILADMKQKTRYNVRLGTKKGVSVRKAGLDELPAIYEMYAETSNRDGFIIRPKDYYLNLWTLFMEAGMATPLVAEVEDDLVAGIILFHFGDRSWYLYGMSRNLHREKMPNYLLQWEAIKLSKSLGCKVYDLWGAPDVFNESDRMWGVYRFKEGLGAKVVQTTGALDYPVNQNKYKIIQEVLPKVLAVTRKIRRRQIKSELSD